MNAPINSSPKWILYKHTSSFEIVKQTALELKFASTATLSNTDRRHLAAKLKAKGLYSPRNPEEPLDSIQHRINTLLYYMFGYREPIGREKRFIFSPLGNLFFKNIENEDKLRKILLTMLWGKQFPDPFFGTPANFRIFPFRLLFALILDNRLESRLSPLEYCHCVSTVEELTSDSYEKIVASILEFRALNSQDIQTIFKANEHHYVNAFHEWEYTSRLLESFGLITKTESSRLFKLHHGSTTNRWITDYNVTISPKIEEFCEILLIDHSKYENPIEINDPERLRVDSVKEVYSFCPPALLHELDLAEDSIEAMLANLPKLIKQYSANGEEDAPTRFEVALTNAMNLFVDVEATHLAGSGNTDIECLYFPAHKKFAVEAKSTATKLTQVNAGRLELHRNKISAEYTLVITPRYTPSVLTDIRGTRNVIVLVNTFTEYLYNALATDARNLSYGELHNLAQDCMGGDMSEKLSRLTLERFAVGEREMAEAID